VKEHAVTTDIGIVLRQWLDVLAGVYFQQSEAWRGRRALVVTRDEGRLVIRRAPADVDLMAAPGQPAERHRSRVVAVVEPDRPLSAEVAQLVRNGFVILELASENVAVRRIAVPAQARDFVDGIVRNQIERLSPWRADQAVYGFAVDSDGEDPTTLSVRVLIASRAVIDAGREQLAALGLSVDRIVALLPKGDGAEAVTLWSRLVDVSPETRTSMRQRIGIGIAGTIAACLGLGLWAMVSAQFIRAEGDDAAVRIESLRRQMQAPLTLKSAASLPANQRVWYEKEMSPSAAIVLEALSRALPDTAHLTELSLQGATLSIAGLTSDAPSLIAPLEHSGSLTDVRFSGPTTRGTDDGHFAFHIVGLVEPQSKLPDDKK
jgi:general secretion pathway protein L